ncbi:MAG TPA: hypothetical protein VKD72_11010, partial [Gemmataceae bacterium]|nr:hypothetical protein [Gemmataceae bacterium]
ALAVALVCVLEQGRSLGAYYLAEHRRDVGVLIRAVPSDCRTFLVVPVHSLPTHKADLELHLDAMWASLVVRVPTVNGYSARNPPRWEFEGISAEEDVENLLRQWLGPCRVSVIRPDGGEVRLYAISDK